MAKEYHRRGLGLIDWHNPFEVQQPMFVEAAVQKSSKVCIRLRSKTYYLLGEHAALPYQQLPLK